MDGFKEFANGIMKRERKKGCH